MKKIFVLSLSAFCFLSSPLFGTEMGNFFVGFKYWYTFWESGALKFFDTQLAQTYNDLGVPISVDSDPGPGFLSGPIFGYQTPDGKLNVSFAPMVFNHSSQKQSITDLSASGETVVSDVDMYRRDFDLAISYSLSDLRSVLPFFEYCKLFVGFKHQVVDLDIDSASYTNGIENFDRSSHMEMNYVAQMPTIGLGIAYPFTQKVVLNVQGGIGLVFLDSEDSHISIDWGDTRSIDPDNSVSYNAEVGLNILPLKKMIVQVGYRYQQWKFSVKNEEDFTQSDNTDDVTHGPGIVVVYAF